MTVIHSAISQERVTAAHARLCDNTDPAGVPVEAFLTARGFTRATLMRFQVMAAAVGQGMSERPMLGVPWADAGRFPLVRQFSILNAADSAETEWRDVREVRRGRSRYRGLFNVDSVRGQKHVVLCGDEFDVMAIYQATACKDCPDPPVAAAVDAHAGTSNTWVKALEAAESITLWMDSTEQGELAAANLVKLLGAHRCRIASITQEMVQNAFDQCERNPINAQDLLRFGLFKSDIIDVISDAATIENSGTVRPSFYRAQIEERIWGGAKALGIPFPDEGMQAHLRGARKTEVIWFSAHTKHGKTTALTEMGEGFARAGWPTCMCMLEGSGPQVVTDNAHQRMIGMRISTLRNDDERRAAVHALDIMDQIPLHLVPLRGMHRWDTIASHLTHAVKREGCAVIILDHFHQIAPDDDKVNIERHTDKTIHLVESLAAELNVPIILAGHPHGLSREIVPTARSAKGGSSIMQVVSGSVSLWRPEGIPGQWKGRDVKVTPDGWEEMTINMNHDEIVYFCTLKRHAEAKTGHWLRQFDPRSLRSRYVEPTGARKPTGEPLDDDTRPWTTTAVPVRRSAADLAAPND